MTEYRAGHVSIIGKPNVGKSTLLNQLIDQKISIVSRKPQTTRFNINGIKNSTHYQIIYVDTPGLQLNPKYSLNRYMNKDCLLYTSPSPRDGLLSRMPSSA